MNIGQKWVNKPAKEITYFCIGALTFACSKAVIETLEKDVEYIQS